MKKKKYDRSAWDAGVAELMELLRLDEPAQPKKRRKPLSLQDQAKMAEMFRSGQRSRRRKSR